VTKTRGAITLTHLIQIVKRFLDGIERVPNGEIGVANLGGIRARENRDASAVS